MFAAYTFLYALGLCALAPQALLHKLTGGRYGIGLAARLGQVPDDLRDREGAIWIHAVSVGEVNAIRLFVERLAAGDDDAPEIVIAATTNTGFARARDLFGAEHLVVRYPLDFSWAVEGFLDRVRPAVVVLVELEVWPVEACAVRGMARRTS